MIFEITILILAVPVGCLIAWMARDELITGRKWFKAVIVISFLAGVWFFLTKIFYITLTSFFIIIVAFISLIKSYDKKFVKR